MDGYQLAVASPGVTDADARELVKWGPAHDALFDANDDSKSINFHPLASGAYCISQTTAPSAEYSGRGGRQILTHNLILSPASFERFSNNPFRVFEAAFAAGVFQFQGKIPRSLTPITLTGRASPIDPLLLASLSRSPGAKAMAALVGAAVKTRLMGVTMSESPLRIFAGIFNLLPLSRRVEFSFSTGIKYSPRRPFRLIALPASDAERRRLRRSTSIHVFDLTDRETHLLSEDNGWANFVYRSLKELRLRDLSQAIASPPAGIKLEELDSLAKSKLQ